MEVSAPAKTNLWLRVLGQREDGFHDIDTRMVALSLADKITIEVIQGDRGVSLTCSDESLRTDEGNLIISAVRTLEEHCKQTFGLRIHLEKHIPIAAGLGGGSSDAAAVLKGLNRLFGLNLTLDELSDLAAKIGSDVPFFVYDSPCDCTGRGERVMPVKFDQELPVLLVKPGFGVSAAWAYQNRADSIEIPGVVYAPQVCPWGTFSNDLERPVFEKFMFLARLKMWLLDQAETHVALLSGSGSTMFVVLAEAHGGEYLEEKIKAHFGETMWTYLGHTLGGR
ncbi:MAG: 4-(cytidine 5'-diphospho)-2-C-methyl-D-erythritol kinase [Verrucomicrobia bacterium]|nr:4-(cytidine 5'-diphospho)-2-C-methyl-D-erythritol kinase [Verrucomicrobiota bacterium]